MDARISYQMWEDNLIALALALMMGQIGVLYHGKADFETESKPSQAMQALFKTLQASQASLDPWNRPHGVLCFSGLLWQIH